ncbi:MAG TPA: ATP-binding protein [Methylomirabilota bacterium]|nr:ATP-binding protein [Methylomirabilota bacterium]
MSLESLYRIADLVAHVRDPEEIYEPAVDAMIAATGANRASLLLFDQAGVMRFKAWRNLSDRHRAAVDGHSPWTPDARDPAPVLVPDAAADASPGALREAILAEGIRSLGFFPLGRPGRLLGTFMVYYDAPHDFSPLELQIAAMVCHYVAFGLDRVRAEIEITELLDRERAARHDAEMLNRAKDDFLAILSHELRNPLNAIVNAVGVLDQVDGRQPMAVKAQNLIRRQTTHLARLLDDLLDAARIGRGHLEVRLETMDLRAAVGAAVEKLAHRYREKRQHLDVALPQHPVPVRGDANRLQQVVANLLDNASKYSPESSRIGLALEVDAEHAVLRVRDTGIGIPADRRHTIFEPFTQGHPRHSSGGLGIGLSLVKRIVDLHGGAIQVDDGPDGHGSEFTLRLRLTTEPLPAAAGATGPALGRRRLVLIEDNDDGREALAMALRAAGHHVEAAASGQAGIELALRGHPDYVLIDIGLPDVDGYVVAQALRPRLDRAVKLVALTGYGQMQDREQSAAAGFDLHLVKPVAPIDVLRILAGTEPPRRAPTYTA